MPLFLDSCRFYILQYSLVKPATAILTIVTFRNGLYVPGDYSFWGANLWITVVNNLSVSFALYYLVQFYHASHANPSLAKGRPLGKFLSIKAIIFFAFWQALVLDLLVLSGVIRPQEGDHGAVAIALSDFLICVEMVVVAVSHVFIFSAEEHRYGYYPLLLDSIDSEGGSGGPGGSGGSGGPGGQGNAPGVKTVSMGPRAAALDMFALGDVFSDIWKSAKAAPALGQHGARSAYRGSAAWVERHQAATPAGSKARRW